MDNNFILLLEKFRTIALNGYVKGVNNHSNGCGLTFEKLLGKKPDSDYLPDYNGIEIKTSTRFSRYPIGLFSLSFDGPDTSEATYILETYGKQSSILKDKKVLILGLSINEKKLAGNYYFELIMDNKEKRLCINIYDNNKVLIETRGFLNYRTIEDRINAKIKKMAIIYASKKKTDNDYHYRYYKIMCCVFKDFNTFLELINSKDISISLILTVSMHDSDIGANKNKGLSFYIKKDSVLKLFKEVCTYEV